MDSGKVDPCAEEEEGFGPNKDTATSASNNTKDGKRSGKADATTRSKHSVTEQRRRSKINERFQILRELIPNSDQKRDTASFLFEVIQYVQFLQEKVTKYEGSYRPWSSEPTKLMPWRNNHWRNIQSSPNNPTEPDHGRLASCGPIDLQTELPNKTVGIEDGAFSHSLRAPPSLDETSVECSDALNLQDGLAIEGGTINISSVYSHGLLNSVAQALESTGVDLSQANVSVQVNLGKRLHAASIAKDHGVLGMPLGDQPVGTFRDAGNGEDLDQSQKRRKL